MRFLARAAAFLWALFNVASSWGQNGGTLRLEKEIPLPGVEGRIDHFAADVSEQRLFIAALENGSVEVLDARRGQRIAEIKGLQEPQGVCYDAKTDRLYVATGGNGKLHVYDGKTFTVRDTLEFGTDADNVRQDPQSGELWIGYGSGGLGIVNAAGQKSGLVALGAHPESFQFEEHGDRVYVNVPKRLGVAVVDRKNRAAIAHWGLGAALANYPMALDDASKRLFVGCRLPARLVVLDSDSGRIVANLPTVGDSDDIFYDAERRRVYVIGGEGAVDILRQGDPDHYERVGKVITAPGARTGWFVPALRRLYVAVPHRGSQSSKVLIYRTD